MAARPWAAVCRFGAHGDDLIAASVFPYLARKYNLEVITNKPCGVVFENNPHIAKLTYLHEDDVPAGTGLEWQQYFDRRGHEYEFFINLSHSCEGLLAFAPVQTQFYWPTPWRQWWCNRSYLEAVADIVGAPYAFGDPLFFPTEEEWQKAVETKAKVGERCIGWIVAGSRLDKFWPQSALAISRLIRELGVPVVMFGGYDHERNVSEQVMKFVEQINSTHEHLHEAMTRKDAAGTVTHDWPIRRVLTQTMLCDLVISVDTGPAWAAAMCGMPKIMLLSHASEENIVKHWQGEVRVLKADPARVSCAPCHLLHDDAKTCTALSGKSMEETNGGAACMDDIAVEAVIQAARELLNL